MSYIRAAYNCGGLPKFDNGMHVMSGGVRIWTRDGEKHREKGPAEVRPNGYKAWFKKGIRHRKNGPAVIYPDGTEEYWREGKLIHVMKPEQKGK